MDVQPPGSDWLEKDLPGSRYGDWVMAALCALVAVVSFFLLTLLAWRVAGKFSAGEMPVSSFRYTEGTCLFLSFLPATLAIFAWRFFWRKPFSAIPQAPLLLGTVLVLGIWGMCIMRWDMKTEDPAYYRTMAASDGQALRALVRPIVLVVAALFAHVFHRLAKRP